jgi:hypothetical protein
MIMRTERIILSLLLLTMACGQTGRVTSFITIPMTSADLRCPYTWCEDDSWTFISWAVLDSPGSGAVLALESGFQPGVFPEPGTEIELPISGELEDALKSRMASARLVRIATEHRENGENEEAFRVLQRAVSADESWSIPLCNMAIMLLEEGNQTVAQSILEPVAHKYRPSLILSRIAWEEGRSSDALSYLETTLSSPDPPAEALAAAALLYTVTGNRYLASGIWRTILAQPDADSRLRLMAVRFALLEQRRSELEGID